MASLVSNGIAMLAARLAVPLFGFAINVGIARILGVETLGIYVQLAALLLITQTLAGAGMQLLLARDLAAQPENRAVTLGQSRKVSLLSAALATVGFVAYAFLLLPADRLVPALLLASTLLPSAWMAMQEGLFVAAHAHHRWTGVVFAESALKAALAFGAFVLGGGIVSLCAAIAVARWIAWAFGAAQMGHMGATVASVRWRDCLPFVREVLPFAAVLTLSMLYFRVDVLMMQALRGEADTGLYGASLTLFSVALLLPSSAMSAVYPRLSAAFHDSTEGYLRATWMSAKLLPLAMVPVALGLVLLGGWMLRIAFGVAFSDAAPALSLLAATLPLQALNNVLGQSLQAAKLQVAVLRLVVVVLAVHLVFNRLAIARFGLAGAPLAMLGSSLVMTVGATAIFHRRVAPLVLSSRGVLCALAVVAPLALALASPAEWRWVAVAVALAGFVVVVAWGVFSRAERSLLASAMPRWPRRQVRGATL